MSDIYIIYGGGYIGINLAQELLLNDHEVYLTTRSKEKCGLAHNRLTYVEHSVLDAVHEIEKKLKGRRVKGVFYCAGSDYQSTLDSSFQELYELNVTAPVTALESSSRLNADFFFNSSTIHVYGSVQSTARINESVQVKPENLYSRLHYLRERALFEASNFYDIQLIIGRFSNLYGGKISLRGNSSTLVLNDWLNSAITSRTIEVNGNYNIKRDFLHIKSAIKLITNLKLVDLDKFDVINVSSGRNISLKAASNVVKDLLSVRGIEVNIVYKRKEALNLNWNNYLNQKILLNTGYVVADFETEMETEINERFTH